MVCTAQAEKDWNIMYWKMQIYLWSAFLQTVCYGIRWSGVSISVYRWCQWAIENLVNIKIL